MGLIESFWAIWAILGYFGPFEPFWAIWAILGHLGQSGPFKPFGPFWAIWAILGHLGLFESLWAMPDSLNGCKVPQVMFYNVLGCDIAHWTLST